jgi:hypothetical protein
MSQSTKIAVDDGTISVIVTKHVIGEEGRLHPQQQDSQPLPKTHPDTPSIQFCVGRARAARIIHRALSPKYQQFRVDRTQLFGQLQQPLLAVPSSHE